MKTINPKKGDVYHDLASTGKKFMFNGKEWDEIPKDETPPAPKEEESKPKHQSIGSGPYKQSNRGEGK